MNVCIFLPVDGEGEIRTSEGIVCKVESVACLD